MSRLLTLLLLASAQLKVRHTFDKIYGTRVIDRTGNGYHATKPAPGGSSSINTPSGLYLSNAKVTLNTFPVSSTCTASILVRSFQSAVTYQREFFFVNYLVLRDYPTGDQITPRKYYGYTNLNGTPAIVSITTTAVYPNQVWVFLATSKEYDATSGITTFKMYVNDAQVGVDSATVAPLNTLGGWLNSLGNAAIYYEFRFYWGALSLSDMKGTLFEMGAACSDNVDACLSDGSGLCKSNDAYHFDITCAACTMTDYACRDQVTTYEAVAGCTEAVANPDGSCVYPTENTEFCPSGCGACTTPYACLACNTTCQKCNFSACLTCKDASASPQAQACTCNSGFYDSDPSATQSCQACIAECSSCNAATTCLTCADPEALLNTGRCTCRAGFYDSDPSTSQSCLACSSVCSTCDAPSTCLTCADSHADPILGVCNCRDGFYDSDPSSTLSCLACSSECATCDAASTCLTCADSHADPILGVCYCRDGFYDSDPSAVLSCLTCSSECATCDAASTCLTCADLNAQLNLGICTCTNGFYDSDPSAVQSCLACSSECATCNAASTCLTCADPNAQFNLGICTCTNGFYDNDPSAVQSCLACSSECATCNAASTCLTCADSNAQLNLGICTCSGGFYDNDPSAVQSCLTCSSECTTCDAPTSCLTCADPEAQLNLGICTCRGGFYDNDPSAVQNCLACSPECSTCDAASTCLTCADPNAQLNLGICTCLNGFYDNDPSAVQSCLACSSECATCDSASTCLSCADPNAQVNLGICTCTVGFYDNDPSVSQSCLTCSSECTTCDAASTCLTCADSNAQLNLGICTCTVGFYDNDPSTVQSCLTCSSECATCDTPTSCLTCADPEAQLNLGICTCRDGFYDNDPSAVQSCLACSPECSTCDAASTCLTCADPNAQLSLGICSCSDGFYDSDPSASQSCLTCSSECSTCDAPSTCLTCAAPSVLPVMGVCLCIDGFYDNDPSSTLSCLPCKTECATCDSASACLTCADTEAELGNGVCTCRVGFYDDDPSAIMLCLPCDSQCASCTEVSKCLTCADQQALPLDRGCKCKSGFYDADPSSSQSCRPCSSQCSTCDEAEFCLTCVDPNADLNLGCVCKEGTVLGPTGACVTCPDGQFGVRQSCEVCHSDCRTCTTYPSCASCKDLNKVPSSEGCRSCEQGTFLQGAKCEVCPWPCTSCSKEACSTCIANAVVKEGKCSCEEGYSMDAEGCSALPVVSLDLSVSDGNILTLTFSQPVSLTQADVEVRINAVQVSNFTLEQSAATAYELLIGQSAAFEDGSECTVTLNLAETYALTNSSVSVMLFKSVSANSDEQIEANSVFSYTKAANTIAVLSALPLSVISGKPSSAWSLMSCTEMLEYIPMMDIDFPLALVEYFKASADFNLLPNLFSSFAAEDGSVPASAQRQGVDSSSFLENAGQILTTFALSFLFWPLSCLLGLTSRYFIRVALEYRWNFFSRFIVQSSHELQVAALVLLFSATLAPLSTALSCLALLICIGAPAFFTFIIFKNAPRLNDDSEIANRWATLFEEFKNDRGWKSSCFYVVFLVRRLLYITMLFTGSQPLVQVIVSAALTVGVGVYLVVYRPFKEPLLNFCRIFSELGSFFIFVLCGLFLLDLSSTTVTCLKWLVISIGYSITLVEFGVSIYLSVREFKEKFKSWRSGSSRTRVVLN